MISNLIYTENQFFSVRCSPPKAARLMERAHIWADKTKTKTSGTHYR